MRTNIDDQVDQDLDLLAVVEASPGASIAQLALLLGWTRDVVLTHVRVLVQAGLVEIRMPLLDEGVRGKPRKVVYPCV